MALRHDTTEPRPALWGSTHTTGDEVEGDALRYRSGAWVAEAPTTSGEILVSDTVAAPIAFSDLLTTEDGLDLLYEG